MPSASPETTVPGVVGLQQAAAESAIGAAFLIVGNTTLAPSNTVNLNEVISSDPAGGTDVIVFSAVDLVVSDGPATVSVPSVVGEFEGDAIDAVEGAFLVATSSFQADDSVPIGPPAAGRPHGAVMSRLQHTFRNGRAKRGLGWLRDLPDFRDTTSELRMI